MADCEGAATGGRGGAGGRPPSVRGHAPELPAPCAAAARCAGGRPPRHASRPAVQPPSGHEGCAGPAGPTDALPGGRTACPLRPSRPPLLDLICPPQPRAAWASRQRCSSSARWPPLPPSSLGLPSTTRSARTRTSTCSTADPRGPSTYKRAPRRRPVPGSPSLVWRALGSRMRPHSAFPRGNGSSNLPPGATILPA